MPLRPSRAERTVPEPPRLGGVIRAAATDLYFNSIRLISANVVWGVSLLLISYVVAAVSIALAPLFVVMIPLSAGLMGMATTLARRDRLYWSDLWDAMRLRFWRHLALGTAQLVVVIVALADIWIGLNLPGFLGPVLVIGAGYALAAVWVLSIATWPLLLDPVRASEGVRAALRLGLLLVLAHPIRFGGLGFGLALFLAASTVLAAALVTVSGAMAALVLARYVLPAADRLEGRETADVDESA